MEEDLEAITTAIRSMYLPWIEESSRYLQGIVDNSSYPGVNCLLSIPQAGPAGQFPIC